MVSFLQGLDFMKNLGVFSVLATFILITAIIYAILLHLKFFGDPEKSSAARNINLIVSISVAFLFIMVAEAVSFLSLLIPILITGIIVTFFILLLAFFVGIKPERLGEQAEHPAIHYAIIAFVVLAIVAVLNRTMPYLFPWATSEELQNAPSIIQALRATLFHPTVLGLIAMFIIFAVVAYSISSVKKYD